MLITDSMSTHRSEKKWSRGGLEQAASTIAELLEVDSYYVTTSPTEFRERTGYRTGRALGRAHASSGIIYVGLRHKKPSKWSDREPAGFLGCLVHEFVHLRWPKLPHCPRFSEYVRRVYDGEHIPRRNNRPSIASTRDR